MGFASAIFAEKEKDFSIYDREHISLMMDHINSYSRGSLGNKMSLYEIFGFLYGRPVPGSAAAGPRLEVTLNSSVFRRCPISFSDRNPLITISIRPELRIWRYMSHDSP